MINSEDFFRALEKQGFSFFTGVPDSLLAGLCAVMCRFGGERHITAANEGNAIGLAAGHYLASGQPAVVYMQNSGLGNAVNPLLSLADETVYALPMLLIIGWRGEPATKDEPQHGKQGEITLSLLDTLGIAYTVLTDAYKSDLKAICAKMKQTPKPVALVVKKNTFTEYPYPAAPEKYALSRERALALIIRAQTENDITIATTGKTSRELYELRKNHLQGHERDFLTVGSMGHAASVALAVSLGTKKTVYCIDGDGAFLMHLGGLAVVAQKMPPNLKYILLNNGSHESVGGQPTVAFDISAEGVLRALGFDVVCTAENESEVQSGFAAIKNAQRGALIINVNTSSRKDLGRPEETPLENKDAFMRNLRDEV